jgi:SpoVK/Ycf46/Vps4 family AAA+-type ATPase
MKNKIKDFLGLNQEISTTQISDESTGLEKARERLKKFEQERENALKGDEGIEDNLGENLASPFQISSPTVNLDNDVILSNTTRIQLDEGLAKLKFHKTIYEDWNFGSVDKQGRSVILNFYGAPGTGKTLTAEAFAGSLGKPIIKLGIAELESKFMGETSKNIQAVFKLAEEEDAVLFFDEADTLLGKRLSSVTQGIDNEVNAMRSTLLIELERFSGVAIFATNFAKNYDEAFRSRISHHVHFELPDLEARRSLWVKMLVDQIPLSESKEQFVETASELSDGFSGREIRTCMRLVLPKALLEAEKNQEQAKVKLEQLQEVIDRIKQAKVEVANSETKLSAKEISTAKTLLGVNK